MSVDGPALTETGVSSFQPVWPLVLGIGLVLADLVFAQGWVVVGTIAHLAVFLAALAVAARTSSEAARAFCLAFGLVPLSRLIAVATELQTPLAFGEELVIDAALALAGWQLVRIQGLKGRAIGLRRPPAPWMLVALSLASFGLGAGAALLLGVSVTGDWLLGTEVVWITGAGLALVASLIEAFVFWMVLLPAAQRVLGLIPGALFAALIWGVRYGLMPWPYLLAMGLEGLGLAWAATRSRSLFYPTFLHWAVIVGFFAAALGPWL